MNESGIYSGRLEAFHPRVNRKNPIGSKSAPLSPWQRSGYSRTGVWWSSLHVGKLNLGFSVCSRSLMIVLTTTQALALAAAGFFQPFDSVVFILLFKKKHELKFNHLMSLYTEKVSGFLQKLELFKGRRQINQGSKVSCQIPSNLNCPPFFLKTYPILEKYKNEQE